ncbi:MAG: hypothetical protein RLZZ324_241 [Candidatus Parcubacteria bacterium]|jgi:CYTH domain-containing protein/predicted ATPase
MSPTRSTDADLEEDQFERRWLVKAIEPSIFREPYRDIVQGYLDGNTDVRVRVTRSIGMRVETQAADATHKTGRGSTRRQRRRGLHVGDAQWFLKAMPLQIHKFRYERDSKGRTWKIDVFKGPLEGFVIAECGAATATELAAITLPPWITDAVEVTDILTNRHLARMAADIATGAKADVNAAINRLPRVVLTGGPCSGKSGIMRLYAADATVDARRLVHCVPEVASVIIGQVGAFPPYDEPSKNRQFQRSVFRVQLSFESVSLLHAARTGRKGLLLDRGTIDNAAYLDGGMKEFVSIADTTPADEFARYDRVIVLAQPSRDVFEREKANNPARHETFEQAEERSIRTIAAWQGHPDLHVVDGATWDEKVTRACALIDETLGTDR